MNELAKQLQAQCNDLIGLPLRLVGSYEYGSLFNMHGIIKSNIAELNYILGTIDGIKIYGRSSKTKSFSVSVGDSVHLHLMQLTPNKVLVHAITPMH